MPSDTNPDCHWGRRLVDEAVCSCQNGTFHTRGFHSCTRQRQAGYRARMPAPAEQFTEPVSPGTSITPAKRHFLPVRNLPRKERSLTLATQHEASIFAFAFEPSCSGGPWPRRLRHAGRCNYRWNQNSGASKASSPADRRFRAVPARCALTQESPNTTEKAILKTRQASVPATVVGHGRRYT